jgi:hypothetical protein
MTLVEAYHHTRRLDAAASDPRRPGVRAGRSAAFVNTLMLGGLGCLWAGAFAVRFGWF